jgi:hypothetical protein
VFRSLVGQRRGEQAAGHLLSMSCLSTQHHRPIRQDKRHWGDRMSTANKKTGRRQLGNLPQPFSHLALIETMPGMIVLERRAEL